jgi:hypothetical protein
MTGRAGGIATIDKPRLSIAVWVGLAIALIAIGGVIALYTRGRVSLPVPKASLSAFHEIGEGDLTTHSTWRQGLGDGAVTSDEDLIGKVTRQPLGKGEAIEKDSILPAIDAAVLKHVRLELWPENAAAFALKAGDAVELWLAPRTRSRRALSVEAVLLDIPTVKDDAKQPYIVAVDPNDVPDLMEVLGRTRLYIAPKTG